MCALIALGVGLTVGPVDLRGQQPDLDALFCRAFPDDPQCRSPETGANGSVASPTPPAPPASPTLPIPGEEAPPVALQPQPASCPDPGEIASEVEALRKRLAAFEQTIRGLDERVDALLKRSYDLYARRNTLCDRTIARHMDDLNDRLGQLAGLESDLRETERLLACVDGKMKAIETRLARLRDKIETQPNVQGELLRATATYGRFVDYRGKLTELSQSFAYDIDKRERLNNDIANLRSWCESTKE